MAEVKLKTKHIIMLSRLVAKMEYRPDISQWVTGKDTDKKATDKKATEIGMRIIMDLISNAYKADAEFYELIGSLSNKTADEAAESEIEEMTEVLKAVWEKLKGFFG